MFRCEVSGLVVSLTLLLPIPKVKAPMLHHGPQPNVPFDQFVAEFVPFFYRLAVDHWLPVSHHITYHGNRGISFEPQSCPFRPFLLRSQLLSPFKPITSLITLFPPLCNCCNGCSVERARTRSVQYVGGVLSTFHHGYFN